MKKQLDFIYKKQKTTLIIFTLLCIMLMDFILTKTTKILFDDKKISYIGHNLGTANRFFHHTLKKNSSNESVPIYTNSLGFKDKMIRNVKIKNSNRRILFIGDSFTEGVMLAWEDTFVGIIADSLNNFGIEVLNAAVSSYSPILYLKKLDYLINSLGLEISDIVVLVDISDLEDDLFYKKFYKNNLDHKTNKQINDSKFKHELYKILYNNFFFMFHFSDFFHDIILQIAYDEREVSLFQLFQKPNYFDEGYFRSNWTLKSKEIWNQKINDGLKSMESNMLKIVELCSKNNIRMTIGVYPWPSQIYFEDFNSLHVKFWKGFTSQHGIDFINLFHPFFSSYRGNPEEIIDKLFFLKDPHLNKKGNRLVADHFLKMWN